MPAGTTPIFIATPKQPSARIAAANTARDGSGVLVALFTAGANGARVDTITFTSAQLAAAASALKVMRVFISDPVGANFRLRTEILLPTLTPSSTVIGAVAVVTFTNGLVLEPGQVISVTQSIYATAADQTDVFLQGGNY